MAGVMLGEIYGRGYARRVIWQGLYWVRFGIYGRGYAM